MGEGVISAGNFVPPSDLSELIERSDLIVKATAGELSVQYGFEWFWPLCAALIVAVVHFMIRRHPLAKTHRGLLRTAFVVSVAVVSVLSVRVQDTLRVAVTDTLYGSTAAENLRIDVRLCPVILDRSMDWVLFLQDKEGRVIPAWPGHFALGIPNDGVIWRKRGSTWTYDRLLEALGNP